MFTNLLQASGNLSRYKVIWQFIALANRHHRISPQASETFSLPTVSKLLSTLTQDNPAETDVAGGGINTNLMEVMRLLIESETVLEWPASIDQVGGSLGLRTSERAVSKR